MKQTFLDDDVGPACPVGVLKIEKIGIADNLVLSTVE